MSGQVSLFDVVPVPQARQGDPQTALDAARSIAPGRTERLILDLFAREPHPWFMGGFTADELAARLPQCHPPTVKTALSRLVPSEDHPERQVFLEDSGERRLSVRGRPQIVWKLRGEK